MWNIASASSGCFATHSRNAARERGSMEASGCAYRRRNCSRTLSRGDAAGAVAGAACDSHSTQSLLLRVDGESVVIAQRQQQTTVVGFLIQDISEPSIHASLKAIRITRPSSRANAVPAR